MTRTHKCIQCGEECDCADDLVGDDLTLEGCIGCSDCDFDPDDDDCEDDE